MGLQAGHRKDEKVRLDARIQPYFFILSYILRQQDSQVKPVFTWLCPSAFSSLYKNPHYKQLLLPKKLLQRIYPYLCLIFHILISRPHNPHCTIPKCSSHPQADEASGNFYRRPAHAAPSVCQPLPPISDASGHIVHKGHQHGHAVASLGLIIVGIGIPDILSRL